MRGIHNDHLDDAMMLSALPKFTRQLIVLAEIPAALGFFLQLYEKPFPMWGYLAAVLALSLLAAFSALVGQRHRVFAFVQLFFVGFLVRSAYYIATRYSVPSGGDSYGEYGVLVTFLASGTLTNIGPGPGPLVPGLALFSAYPALQIASMALSDISGIDPLRITLVMPWVFYIGWFAFAYLLFRELERSLGLSSLVTNLGLLVLASSPFIPMPPIYKYQDMALVLWGGLLYLGCRQFSRMTKPSTVLTILFLAGLAITHHYTSFIAFLFLIVMWVFSKRGVFGGTNFHLLVTTALLIAVILLLWSTSFSLVIWRHFTPFIRGLRIAVPETFSGMSTEVYGKLRQLTPAWALLLLPIRDLAIFVPAVAGFLLLIKWKKTPAPQRFFLMCCSVAFILPVLADAITARISVLTERDVSLWMCILAFLSAFCYYQLTRRLRYVGKLFLTAVMILLVFSVFIGFSGHTFAPVHLYDPTVTFQEVGEIPPEWPRMAQFLERYVELTKVNRIVTDQVWAIALALPVDQWGKVVLIGDRGTSSGANNVVVAYNNLSTSYTNPIVQNLDPNFNQEAFQHSLEARSLVYSDGQFKVWI